MTQNYDELLELADDIEATWLDEDYKGSTLGKLAAAVRELQAENATIYNQAIEAAAKVVQDHAEAIMTHNNERFLQPRRNGNLLGLAFVDAILRLKRPTP